MTPTELRDAILGGPLKDELVPYAHTESMEKISGPEAMAKDQAIADIMNASGRYTEPRSEHIGYGSVLRGLGAAMGSSVLDKLEAAATVISPVKWAMRLVERGEFDIGSDEAQAQIQALVAGNVLDQAEADALCALGLAPINITAADVSIALRGPRE